MVKAAFPTLPYVSLEKPDIRQIALTDPRGFLSNYPTGAILDEVQNTPGLFSYIQKIVDENRQVQFILTGSSNFLLMRPAKISQTLAGRTAILHLLPLSFEELKPGAEQYENVIFKGQYPRIYDRAIAPTDFYPAYIQTYVEKDVRLMKNIGDINAFIQFTQLCAGRVGQLLIIRGWRTMPESALTRRKPGSLFWRVPTSYIGCNPFIRISTSAWFSRPNFIFMIRASPARCLVSTMKTRSTCIT